MKYLKTLSIMFVALFLFGCTREVPSSQLEQSSLSSFVQPVQSSSDSASSSVSSQSSSESSVPAENGSVPQMLENGWHYTDVKKWWLHGWVKDGQEFVLCNNSILEFYSLDNQFLRTVPFDSSRLPKDYKLFTASNRIFLLESSRYPVPLTESDKYEPLLYEKDGQEYLSGVTMLDLEGNILLQIPPLDVSQDKDGDFHFSFNGEPVSVKPSYIDVTCVNDDLIFLSLTLNWYERKSNELDATSHTELYYFIPSKNKLVCIGKNFTDGRVYARNNNACLFFYRNSSSPKNGLLFHVGYLDENGVQYPYPGMLFSDAAMDGNSIYLSYSPYNLEYENFKFWRTSPDDFILHNIPFPGMEEPLGAYIPIYRAKVYLIDENYMLFDNRAFNIVTGEYGTDEQAVQLFHMTWNNLEINYGIVSHYVAWADLHFQEDSNRGYFHYFKILPLPKVQVDNIFDSFSTIDEVLKNELSKDIIHSMFQSFTIWLY
jgi:hypothetical protein